MEHLFSDHRPILTIGHSNRTAAALRSLLKKHGVELVVDVRRFPSSRRHPHFTRDVLEADLERAGIAYRHEADLGGHRKPREDSLHHGIDDPAFRGYADHMQSAEFRDALQRVSELATERTVCLMCAERLPEHCHRRLLADQLLASGARITHVLAEGDVAEHVLSQSARVRRGGLVEYPAPPTRQLELFA